MNYFSKITLLMLMMLPAVSFSETPSSIAWNYIGDTIKESSKKREISSTIKNITNANIICTAKIIAEENSLLRNINVLMSKAKTSEREIQINKIYYKTMINLNNKRKYCNKIAFKRLSEIQ